MAEMGLEETERLGEVRAGMRARRLALDTTAGKVESGSLAKHALEIERCSLRQRIPDLQPFHAAVQIPAVDEVHHLQRSGVQAEDQPVITADAQAQRIRSRTQRHDPDKGGGLTRRQTTQQNLSGAAHLAWQSAQRFVELLRVFQKS